MKTEYAVSSGLARPRSKRQPTGTLWHRFARRIRAVARLIGRHRRTLQHHEDLRRLDERTLRDLGITQAEIPSVIAELAGRAGATRRRTDADDWRSASSRFRTRAIDQSL
jgi:uncharacterized protein YjiS (DUF1127 family)